MTNILPGCLQRRLCQPKPGSNRAGAQAAVTLRVSTHSRDLRDIHCWAVNPHSGESPLPEPTGEEAAEEEHRESLPKSA